MDDVDVTILVRREIVIGRHGERGEAVGPFAPARAPDRCDAEEGIITDQARGVDRLATLHQTELARQQQARAVDRRGFGLEERDLEDLGIARRQPPMKPALALALPVPDHPTVLFATTGNRILVALALHLISPNATEGQRAPTAHH